MRTLGWLTDMVRSNMLMVYTASVDSPADAPPIGLATGHAIPASLVMGRFWQLRDLYVLPRPGAKERQPLWSEQSERQHSPQAPHDCPS